MPFDAYITAAPRQRAKAAKKLLVADLFCGAGGSSTGARKALGRLGFEMTLTCVNHWPVAIETHTKNHPEARHYCQDVSALRPLAAVPEGYLDLLMASPTCTHHSRARGGRPTSDQQRMDPWHVITWLTELRVRCLLIENVPEFMDWGPVDKRSGKPLASRKGEYFRQWVKTIKALGFTVDWRVLNAADYGDATTRQRFFLMARSDGKKIVWPEPTHSKDGGRDLLGHRRKWRAAREIIDWAHPGRSIFGRKKALAPKTLARIEAGAKKFHWPEPFLVVLRQHMSAASVDQPLPTITAGGTHIGLAQPELRPFVIGQHGGSVARDTAEPLMTIAGGGAISLTEPVLIKLKGRSDCGSVDDPTPTITTKQQLGVTEPVLIAVTGGDKPKAPKSVDEPLGTITTHNGVGMAEAFMFPVNQGSERLRGHRSVNEPMPTILTRESLGIATPMISPYYGSGSGETCKSVEQPLDSITTKARFGVVEPVLEAFIVPQFGERPGQTPRTHAVDAPLPAVTSHGAGAIVEPVARPVVIQTDQTGSAGVVRSADEPLSTVVSKQSMALVEPCLITVAHGEWPDPGSAARRAHSVDDPVPGITASGRQVAVCEPVLTAADAEILHQAAAQGRLVVADGLLCIIDIRFRMLEPYELARAMGFSDQESDYEFAGTKTDITKQIGNAVPVNTASALVGALMDAPRAGVKLPRCP